MGRDRNATTVRGGTRKGVSTMRCSEDEVRGRRRRRGVEGGGAGRVGVRTGKGMRKGVRRWMVVGGVIREMGVGREGRRWVRSGLRLWGWGAGLRLVPLGVDLDATLPKVLLETKTGRHSLSTVKHSILPPRIRSLPPDSQLEETRLSRCRQPNTLRPPLAISLRKSHADEQRDSSSCARTPRWRRRPPPCT